MRPPPGQRSWGAWGAVKHSRRSRMGLAPFSIARGTAMKHTKYGSAAAFWGDVAVSHLHFMRRMLELGRYDEADHAAARARFAAIYAATCVRVGGGL